MSAREFLQLSSKFQCNILQDHVTHVWPLCHRMLPRLCNRVAKHVQHVHVRNRLAICCAFIAGLLVKSDHIRMDARTIKLLSFPHNPAHTLQDLQITLKVHVTRP